MDRPGMKVFAFLTVALMLTVAVASPVMAEDPEPYDYTTYSDDPEYGFAWIPFILGIVLVSTIWAITEASAPDSPAGDQQDIYKQLRDIYGEEWMNNMDVSLSYITSIMPADTTLWAFTSAYWDRAAELVVAEQWKEGDDYDPNATLEWSLMRNNVNNYIYDWQATVDRAYNNIVGMRQHLAGDCYGNMTMSVDMGNGTSITAPTSASDQFYMDMCQYVSNATRGQYVYIDTDATDGTSAYNAQTSGTLYNFSNIELKLTKVSLAGGDPGGNTITVPAKSSVVVTNSPSGLYRIDSSTATFAGPLTKAAEDDTYHAADVGGAIVFNDDGDLYLCTPNGKNVNILSSSGSSWSSSTLRFHMHFDGRDHTDTYSVLCDGSSYNIVATWDDMIQQINDVIDEAATAGETIWGIFDVAQESSAFISPSSLTQSIQGMSLSAEEKQAITIQGMMKLADYWNNNEGELTSYEFIRNTESVDLIVYGNIYYNGQLWMENAIFTPYMTVSQSQTLSTGEECEWGGPGFAMVWAQEENYYAWDGETSSSTQALVNLDSTYSIDVKLIEKGGEEIDTITLTPTLILRQTTDPADPSGPVDPVQVLDGSMLIMIIIIELGIILFLLGLNFDQPVIGLVAALITIAVGLIFSDTIASIALGTFSWGNLF